MSKVFIRFISVLLCNMGIHSLMAQGILFSDVTSDLSINAVPNALEYFGHGVSAADYDNDGDIDFYSALGQGGPNRLYQNLGNGQFVEKAADAGLDLDLQSRASLWLDVTNDGLLDLVLAGDCFEVDQANCTFLKLFLQHGDHSFFDATNQSEIILSNNLSNDPEVAIGGLAGGDLNNDGYLDIMVTLWRGAFVILLNNQDGTFHPIQLGAQQYRWQPMIYDFNQDGWQDMYINVDFGPNELWVNDGTGSFVETAGIYGLDNNMNDMGMALADYDNDGDIDLYVTNITRDIPYGRNVLFQNNSTTYSGSSFEEIGTSLGIASSGWDWGTTLSDFNNDGWLDLASTNGHVDGSLYEHDQSSMWKRMTDGSFENVTANCGFSDTLSAATLIAADIDRDGDLDLLQSIKKTLGVETTYPVRIYKNQHDHSNNYLVVRPRQNTTNVFAIGATVRASSNGTVQSRLITAGCSFYGQEPAEAFFGTGAAGEVGEVSIVWPDGSESTHQNITTNQVITITKPDPIPTPLQFAMTLKTNQVSLNWEGNASYDVLLERNIMGEEVQYLDLGKDTGFTDEVDWSAHVYKYRVRFTDQSGKSRWSEYLESPALELAEEILEIEIEFDTTQYSVARLWNEVLLEAIRNDYARPTIHARNLFHISAAMYDAWSVFEADYSRFLLGQEKNGFRSSFGSYHFASEIKKRIQQQAISHAAFRLIEHRFKNSPGSVGIYNLAESLMDYLDFDPAEKSTDYSLGSAAALGNYIAQQYIEYGLNDKSNEGNDYTNQYYEPVNPYLDPESDGNATLVDPNRWQPLAFDVFIDQSGNEIAGSVPGFLGAEWGHVYPFSLKAADKTTYTRDGHEYPVYFDPGPPPYLATDGSGTSDQYRHGFSMVAVWSGHLDISIDRLIDISPASIGNYDLGVVPQSFEDYDQFYAFTEGGDPSTGHATNPSTGQPYEPQMVQLGNYGRILAEFWADGPDSETPPGHWFTILNKVSDDDQLVKKFGGSGEELSNLEWDIKSYFILGGAMHDVAVTAWGIKGYYDYVRPICAIRFMADKGQSSDPQLPGYDPQGIELVDGYIELVGTGDPLAGDNDENVGKVKLYAWKGHEYIDNVETDVAGVDWILAEDWWPYQRPTFVTPNFAGYISGHSTYSRAAAEVLTRITGDPFFPGGLGEFHAPKNEFLVFEEGPSEDITLQWATYRDAADQCSLSRIWGGIHPPADDLPGRVIGERIGHQAFDFGVSHFQDVILGTRSYEPREILIYPVPASEVLNVEIPGLGGHPVEYTVYDLTGRVMLSSMDERTSLQIPLNYLKTGRYVLHLRSGGINTYRHIIRE